MPTILGMRGSLNCPTCGAPAPGTTAAQCEYCASTLTSVACPSCFGSMFAGMQFCPHCGAKGERTIEEGKTIPCPGCKSEMRAVRVGATPLFECQSCHGTWLDSDTFRQLCLSREERGIIAAQFGSGAADLAAPRGGSVRYVPCPLCGKVMNRENFGRRSGVIIDVCKGHGVWFEQRELQSVMSFIDRGGLERARLLEAERQREQQRADRRTLGQKPEVSVESSTLVYRETTATTSGPGGSLLDEALRMLFS